MQFYRLLNHSLLNHFRINSEYKDKIIIFCKLICCRVYPSQLWSKL